MCQSIENHSNSTYVSLVKGFFKNEDVNLHDYFCCLTLARLCEALDSQ